MVAGGLRKEAGTVLDCPAFRITGTRSKPGDGDRVEVLVQVVADGESMPLPLRRFGTEWKLGD